MENTIFWNNKSFIENFLHWFHSQIVTIIWVDEERENGFKPFYKFLRNPVSKELPNNSSWILPSCYSYSNSNEKNESTKTHALFRNAICRFFHLSSHASAHEKKQEMFHLVRKTGTFAEHRNHQYRSYSLPFLNSCSSPEWALYSQLFHLYRKKVFWLLTLRLLFSQPYCVEMKNKRFGMYSYSWLNLHLYRLTLLSYFSQPPLESYLN